MSSIPFSHYLCQSLKRYGVFFPENKLNVIFLSFISRRLFACTKTGLRLQSFSRYCIIGGRFFRFTAKPSCCSFSAKRPRMDVVLLSNEFDISSNSLSGAVHGCIVPDRGYPPLPFRCVQELTSLSILGREFAYRKLTAG